MNVWKDGTMEKRQSTKTKHFKAATKFVDEMNACRVVGERAMDKDTAMYYGLTHAQVLERHRMLIASINRNEGQDTIIIFASDGSGAVQDAKSKRWDTQ